MKNLLLCTFLFLMALLLLSCQNTGTKTYGGKSEIKINNKEKFVNITWKDNDLWILTRPRKEGEQPEKYWFYEKSNFGLAEGQLTIIEE